MDCGILLTQSLALCSFTSLFVLNKAESHQGTCVDDGMEQQIPVFTFLLKAVKDGCGTNSTTSTTSPSTTTTTDGGSWSPWSFWAQCTATCGVGSQFRARQCIGGSNCPGVMIGTKACHIASCATIATTTITTETTSTTTETATTKLTTIDPCDLRQHCANLAVNETVLCSRCVHDTRYHCVDVCSHFLTCTTGRLTKQPCPSFLWYNPENKQCSYPRNVSAEYCNLDPTIAQACDFGLQCDQLALNETAECAGCVHGTQYHCVDVCSNYLICNHDTLAKQPCPARLWYNPVSEQCAFPRDVPAEYCSLNPNSTSVEGCNIDKLCTELAIGESAECPTCELYKSYACPEICHVFLTCLPGGLQKAACSDASPPLAFNPDKRYCDFKESVPEIYCRNRD